MIHYRFVRLDKNGNMHGPAMAFLCEDDDEARIRSQHYIKDYAVEIWDGDRRVALIPADE